MRIKELFTKLKETDEIDRCWDELQPKLQKKITRLNARNTQFQIERFHDYNPTTIIQYLQIPRLELEILSETDFSIENYYREANNLLHLDIIYNEQTRQPIRCYRGSDKLIIEPMGQTWESWSRPSYLTGTKSYTKHLYKPKSNYSTFAKGLNYKELEHLTFFKGRGLAENNKRLFMYAAFDQIIGTARSSKDLEEPTRVVKVQIDRVYRPKRTYISASGKKLHRKQGFMLNVHGYPISMRELEQEFPEGKNQIVKEELPLK